MKKLLLSTALLLTISGTASAFNNCAMIDISYMAISERPDDEFGERGRKELYKLRGYISGIVETRLYDLEALGRIEESSRIRRYVDQVGTDGVENAIYQELLKSCRSEEDNELKSVRSLALYIYPKLVEIMDTKGIQ